jgi:hypothetical protein
VKAEPLARQLDQDVAAGAHTLRERKPLDGRIDDLLGLPIAGAVP